MVAHKVMYIQTYIRNEMLKEDFVSLVTVLEF